MRILIIEDDRLLRHTLVETFRDEGFAVDGAEDGEEGIYKLQQGVYDAAVLDVMMPKNDGWDVLKKVRPENYTPILMLTAKDTVPDRVKGLNLGADDYLAKPYDSDELVARIRALIRRSSGKTQSVYEFKGITLDVSLRKVIKGGKPVSLTASEYNLLEYLAIHQGEVVSRTLLYERLFDDNDDTLSNLLDVFVSRLRKKLGKEVITTRRGHGYCIE